MSARSGALAVEFRNRPTTRGKKRIGKKWARAERSRTTNNSIETRFRALEPIAIKNFMTALLIDQAKRFLNKLINEREFAKMLGNYTRWKYETVKNLILGPRTKRTVIAHESRDERERNNIPSEWGES